MNIRDEDEGDGSNERGVYDERAGSNERGVYDEEQDGVSSNHGSTCSSYNYDRSVKTKGFDTQIDPMTRKKELYLYGTTE